MTQQELDAIIEDPTVEMSPDRRVEAAITLGLRYGQIDGSHHRLWVIDQMLRILLGVSYKNEIKRSCDGEDGPDTYSWDCGIAP